MLYQSLFFKLPTLKPIYSIVCHKSRQAVIKSIDMKFRVFLQEFQTITVLLCNLGLKAILIFGLKVLNMA
jgi:hypothetical protein